MNRFFRFIYTTIVLTSLINIHHAVYDAKASDKVHGNAVPNTSNDVVIDDSNTLERTELVKSIEIIGNNRIHKDMILNKLEIEIDDQVGNSQINSALHNLYSTNLFSTIEINFNEGVLTVQVVEAPIIAKVEGAENNNTYQMILRHLGAFGIKSGAVLNEKNLQDAISNLKQQLHLMGYLVAQVSTKVEDLENNRCKLSIEVDFGPHAVIKDISFIGNEYYSDDHLRSIIASSRHSVFHFLSNNGLSMQFIEADKMLLRDYYERNGFIDFKDISVNYDYMPSGDYVTIIYHISEGKRYYFRDLKIEVKDTKIDTSKLHKLLKIKPESYFDLHKVKNIAHEITEQLAPEGNYTCVYDFTKDPDTSSIDVVFTIYESPKNIIESISINGNTRTYDKVIRRELLLHELDILNLLKVEQSKNRILGLSFIENVQIQPLVKDESGRCELLIDVVEKKSFTSLSLTGGVTAANSSGSLNTGLNINTSLAIDNIFGTGNKLFLQLGVSADKYSGTIAFDHPGFLDQDVTFGFSVFGYQDADTFLKKMYRSIFESNDPNPSPSDLNFEQLWKKEKKGSIYGFKTHFLYFLTDNISHDISYTLQRNKGELEGIVANLMNINNYDDVYSIVGNQLTYSTLDNMTIPSKGFTASYGLEIAGLGGSVSYIKNTVKSSYYTPLFSNNLIFKLSAEFNAINSIGDEGINSFDLLTLAHGQIRGFEYNGIGPMRTADGMKKKMYLGDVFIPHDATLKIMELEQQQDKSKLYKISRVGGNYSLFGSAEVFLPISSLNTIHGRISAFADVGSVWGFNCSKIKKHLMYEDTTQLSLKASVGVAFSCLLMGAPVKIYYGVPIVKSEKDLVQEFGFSISANI